MAIEHVTAVLHGLFGVDPSAKLIMLILAEHARRGSDRAWPSIDTLARLACLQRRQAQAIVHHLVECGWVSLAQASKGGRGCTNVYQINMAGLIEARNDAARRTVSGPANDAADNMVTFGEVARHTVQSMTRNRAVGDTNRAVEGSETVQPSAPEPVLTVINSTGPALEPERAPASAQATATPIGDTSTPPLKKLITEPERQRSKRDGSSEPSEHELERRKRAQLKSLAEYGKSRAVRQ